MSESLNYSLKQTIVQHIQEKKTTRTVFAQRNAEFLLWLSFELFTLVEQK